MSHKKWTNPSINKFPKYVYQSLNRSCNLLVVKLTVSFPEASTLLSPPASEESWSNDVTTSLYSFKGVPWSNRINTSFNFLEDRPITFSASPKDSGRVSWKDRLKKFSEDDKNYIANANSCMYEIAFFFLFIVLKQARCQIWMGRLTLLNYKHHYTFHRGDDILLMCWAERN